MKLRTAMGIAMMLSSIAFFVGGGMVISATIDMKERQERQAREADEQCIRLLGTLPGASVAQTGDAAVVVVRDVADPRKALTDATVAAMMCPGRTLEEVCLGDKCAGAQGTVTLRFKLTGGK